MNFFSSIKKLFSSLENCDDENKRVSAIVKIFSAITVTGMGIMLIFRLILGNYAHFMFLTSVFIMVLTPAFLIKLQHVKLAGSIITYSLTLLFFYMALVNDGINDTALIAIPGVFVMAGLIFPKLHYYLYISTVAGLIFLLGHLEINGFIVNKYSLNVKYSDIVDLVEIIVISAAFIRLLSDSLIKALNRSWLNGKELMDKTEKLVRSEIAMKEAKEKAEEMSRLKTGFLTQISHEIRTPVNTMLSYSSLLKNELDTGLCENSSLYFDTIEKGGKRLTRTIEMLLTMSQFQTETYESKFIEILLYEDVIKKLFSKHGEDADEKHLDFQIKNTSSGQYVKGDYFSLYHLFGNLIDNAIKFTNNGGVKVSMYDDARHICVDIEDTGIGMSEKYLRNLFSPFSQEEFGYTRSFDGNGLGLSLVKKYAEVNDIIIQVKSEKNQGTKFSLRFSRSSIC